MGSLATMHHFDELADRVAAAEGGSRFEVLTFDYRGAGRSTAQVKLAPQSTALLAADTLALLQHVWGQEQPVHVYGASLGGMVAQKLALLLLEAPASVAAQQREAPLAAACGTPRRLKSLFLAVTSSSYGLARFMPISPKVYRFLLPLVLPSDPAAMVRSLLPKCFDAAYLESKHLATGETMAALWTKRWVAEYGEWFIFNDVDACAAQCPAADSHYLSKGEANLLVSSGVPILVAIAKKDALIPPHAQRGLAKMLRAKTHTSAGGHMGSAAEFDAFTAAVVQHFSSSVSP
jgi:pimeloyl-ACP methyl ester carboxylesterase